MANWNQSAWFAVFAAIAVKSAAVLAMAWMVAFLLRGRSAAARHLVWTAASAAVLALPLLTISLPGLPVRGASVLLPVSVTFHATATTSGAGATTEAAPSSGSLTTMPASRRWPDWRTSILLLWAAGAVLALIQMVGAWWRINSVRRAAGISPDADLAADLSLDLGIRHEVDVLETAEGAMPATIGILRPAILMPCDAADWSYDLRRTVLLHELAHVRRGDLATQLLARLALVLHWWNPLAWIAWREFLKERERATDDLVLGAGTRASDYATHLLEVARSHQATAALAWAAVAMARPSQLEGRLLAILSSSVNRRAAGRTSAAVAAVAAVVLVAPLAAVRAQERTPPPVPADVEATIRSATAQRNPAMLEQPAKAFEARDQYDTAKKLLESAAAIREETDGSGSVSYGIGLLKIADLEKSRGRFKDAAEFYEKALAVLGDRVESVPALMYLAIHRKNPAESLNYLERAARLDPMQAGPAKMWMAVIQERQNNLAEAEALYKGALALETAGSNDAQNTTRLYARLLRKLGRDEEAKSLESIRGADTTKPNLSFRSRASDAEASSDHAAASVARTQPADGGVYRVGNGVAPPALIYKVEPQYSDTARAAGFEGTVVVYVEIHPDGLAYNTKVIRSLGLGLDEKAVEAINKWRFRPGTKDGAPVTVAATIEVNFRLL